MPEIRQTYGVTCPLGLIDFEFLGEERAGRAAVRDVEVVAGAGQRDEQQAQ
jgi:hypothetical protein